MPFAVTTYSGIRLLFAPFIYKYIICTAEKDRVINKVNSFVDLTLQIPES